MQVNRSNTTTYKLTDLDRLDPITVYTENHEPGKGKIIIECYGKSWSSYWGAMGGKTVEEFFCSCDEHYLASNLSSISDEILDYNAVSEAIGETVNEDNIWTYSEKISEVYGEEWWLGGRPVKANPEYEHLCRIIVAVQLGLSETLKHLPPQPTPEEQALEKIEASALRRTVENLENELAIAKHQLAVLPQLLESSGNRDASSDSFTALMRDITEQEPADPAHERAVCVDYDWLYVRTKEAFSAISAKALRVPDGWKVVPVTPTAEMKAACKVAGKVRVWDDMLNAAPAPGEKAEVAQ